MVGGDSDSAWGSCGEASEWGDCDGNTKGGDVTTGVIVGGPDDDPGEHCGVVDRCCSTDGGGVDTLGGLLGRSIDVVGVDDG